MSGIYNGIYNEAASIVEDYLTDGIEYSVIAEYLEDATEEDVNAVYAKTQKILRDLREYLSGY